MTHCQLQFIVIFELFFSQDCTGNFGSLLLHILKHFCTLNNSHVEESLILQFTSNSRCADSFTHCPFILFRAGDGT
jgi:hypothetical protein